MFKLITLVGLILVEAFTTIWSGCSQESVLKLKVAVCRLDATLGDARAQCNLGTAYIKGNGIGQDREAAAKWWRKAADKGIAAAQFNLGCCYYAGDGVVQDKEKAVMWWRRAAEHGDVQAQYNLGICYYNGMGAERNYKEAFEWLHRAAARGHAAAQFLQGRCYDKGEGVVKDKHKAVEWYGKAAEQGYAEATELNKMRKRLCIGIDLRRSRGMLKLNLNWLLAIIQAMESRRMQRRRFGGFVWLPNRARQMRRIF